MLAGNISAVYTGTFSTHAVELEIQETVVRVRKEDVGGAGSLLDAGFDRTETDGEQARIRAGYGNQVLTGDELHKPDPEGYTKEILLSGKCRSSWGWSRIRGRVRSWDGLVQIQIGAASPHPLGQWIWRGYIHTGGYFIGRWRDTYTPESQNGYEGPLGLVRAGDVYFPSHFPKSLAASAGISSLDVGPDGAAPGPSPNRVNPFPNATATLPKSPVSRSSGGSGSSMSREGSDDPMDGRKRRAGTDDPMMPPSKRQDSERPTSRASRSSGSMRRDSGSPSQSVNGSARR